ncbi:MAG: hypothetical protein DRJ30_07195 [Candidatus Methanomethylicota archaeon]|nr:MAG: hypothetical protein DRJ30_07195 [Candidatus Verstraetearchaeota archaeon]
MRINRIFIFVYFLWITTLLCGVIIYPTYAQSNMSLVTVYSSSDPVYVIKENTTIPTWTRELNIKIPFNISRNWIGKSNVTVHFEFYFNIKSEEWRISTVNYTFILNGKPVRLIREDFEGTWLKGGGSYPETIIKPEMLKENKNNLIIKIKVLQKGLVESKSYFELQIKQPHIKIKALDSDGDGIYDIVDPLPRTNNNYITGILGIIGIPISIGVEKFSTKTKNKR